MKKIIVPVDFSQQSMSCIRKAVELAEEGSEIQLLHFIELEFHPEYLVTAEFRPITAAEEQQNLVRIAEHDRAMQKALESAREMAETHNIRVSSEVRIGAPYPGLIRYVEEYQPDLVVMGAHANPEHFYPLAGTLNERVLRRVKSPVFTLQAKGESPEIRKILYATAMEDDEMPLARVVRRLAALNDAEVHLTWINTPGDFQRDEPVLAYMRVFAERAGFQHFTLNTYNDLSVEDGILSFATSLRPDVIAMATHGRTGWSRLFARGTAEGVSDNGSLPLLTQLVRH